MSVFYKEKSVRKETAHLCSCYFYFENLICRKAAVDGYFISPRYNIDGEKEGWNGQEEEIPVNYYGGIAYFYTDPTYYLDGKLPEWEMKDYTAGEFKQEQDTPEYFDLVFEDTDEIHVVKGEINGKKVTYVMLDSDTMLRYSNGLWYVLEKQTKKLNWENQKHE